MRRRHLGLTLGLMSVALFISPNAAAAECSAFDPTPHGINNFVGYAFTARLVDYSREPDPQLPGASPFNWKIRFDVEHVYRGAVPDPWVGNGWDGNSCNGLDVTAMHVGDELFVSVNHMDHAAIPRLGGNYLIWRRVDRHWEYFDQATQYSPEPGFDPPAAKRASTTAEILALVAPGSMPDTATARPIGTIRPHDPWSFLIVLTAGVALAFERRRRSIRARSEATRREGPAG